MKLYLLPLILTPLIIGLLLAVGWKPTPQFADRFRVWTTTIIIVVYAAIIIEQAWHCK